MPTGMYLSLLASHRQSFDPEKRMLAARFKPEIRDSSVRERLLDVIRTTLGKYIHNDMLQSAAIVTGGRLAGFEVRDLMNHLIIIAFSRGPQHAAQTFYECAEDSDVNMQFITLLDGIRVEQEIDISEGIRLVPVPDNANYFPPYIITHSPGGYMDYYDRTLIILEERVSPIFAHPSEMSRGNARGPFIRSNLNTIYRDFSVSDFCEALSLSANHVVNYTAWWTHLDSDEAYAVRAEGRFPTYTSLLHNKMKPMKVDDNDIQKAMSLYSIRKSLGSEVTQKLRVPIDRWRKSKMDASPIDAFINLGTALESLYLNDAGNTGELRFRLALRAAWHLGSDRADRSSLFDDFKKIYDRRSKAVHTGKLAENEQTPELVARAQELCLKSIVKIIEDGEFPDWNHMVMGS